MRVTDQQIADMIKYQLNTTYDQLTQAQTELATGRQLNTPADNPLGAAVVLNLQASLAQNTAFSSTVTDAQQWLQATDTALSGVNSALTQARTLAVQGANDTLTADERSALGAQVSQLIQQAAQSANADDAGRYVLAGDQTSTAPFAISTAGGITTVTYQGDSGAIQREVSPGQMMTINTPGNESLPAVFSALTKLQTDLQNNDGQAVSNDLQALDQAQSGLMVSQTVVGSRITRLQAVQSSLGSANESLTTQSSQITDANFAQATIDFSTRQTTYQAVLTAASKIIQPSLLDFLK